MILDLYMARRFLRAFGGAALAVLTLMSLVGFVEGMRRFAGEAETGDILALALLDAPRALYGVLPIVVTVAGIALFLSLARSSELVVTRASGRSALRALLGPAAVALGLGMLGVAAINPIVAVTSREHDARVDRIEGASSSLALSDDGLWLRQGGDGQTVIHAARSNADGTRLARVTFLTFAEGGGPARRIEARSARLEGGAWRMEDAKSWPLDVPNPEAAATTHATLAIPSTLTAAEIRDSFGAPGEIGIWELPQFIARLEEAGFAARRHRVFLQTELAQPLFLVAAVLLAACFTLAPQRGRRVGAMVLAAVLAGFGAYLLRDLARILGEGGQIPPALAAWAPPLGCLGLALGGLLHLEEG